MDEQKFIIAEGVNKESTTWVNKVYSEEEFIDKFRSCRVTNIKNGPGFVGGSLYRNNSNRYKSNIKDRILITLDLDNIKDKEQANDIINNIHYRGIVYSTFSNTEEAPRIRIVLFLDKAIEARKYEAVARRVANMIYSDKSVYDQSTFQQERLMYYPMSENINNYFFKELKGECIDPDIIMDFYEPLEANNKINNSDKKQENPLEKKGIIGAFCRTYNIHEVIEKYLYDYYEQSSIETKYKRIGSKDGPGAIVYNSNEGDYAVFLYSHHGSDITCNRLCNAWDLVRLHKFSNVDYEKDKSKNKPEYEKWSLNKMTDLAHSDDDVNNLFIIESVVNDFNSIDGDDFKWIEKLQKTNNYKVANTIDNILIILQNDNNLKGKIKYNEFTYKVEVNGNLPWIRSNSFEWVDSDDKGLRHYIEHTYGITSKQKIDDALGLVINENAYHPVKDYLNSLKWDGEYRIENLLIQYLGAEDNEWSRVAIKKWLVAAVKRIFEPGCKFDEMIIFTGMQGLGKSTFFSILASDEWFTDDVTNIENTQKVMEVVAGKWIVEFSELKSLNDANSVKKHLGKKEYKARLAYDKRSTIMKVQCVYAGTTNDLEFLTDTTGNRRFWVLDVGKAMPNNMESSSIRKYYINKINSELPIIRDQIWAEAVYLYKNNYSIILSDVEEELAILNADMHQVEDTEVGIILDFLEKPITTDWYKLLPYERKIRMQGDALYFSECNVDRDKICALEVWRECYGRDGNPSIDDIKDINRVLSQLKGWVRHKSNLRFGAGYGTQRAYIKVN